MQRHTVTLDHPTDWPGFRTVARALVQADVPPQAVDWRCQADAANDLFAPEPHSQALPNPAPHAPTLRVPPDFMRSASSGSCRAASASAPRSMSSMAVKARSWEIPNSSVK